ncbi:MAG: hypothetical protein KKB30_02470 [Proteobacteria bacterium]|nr:hypothetical protein [Pseudomonadota bacterium]MBU1715780.1 hypothetical protein [Pseudomonadota bacterium]
MIDQLQKNSFEPHLHTIFTIHPEGVEEPVEVTLVEVVGSESKAMTQFSALFKAAAGVFLPQGTYRIGHKQMGKHDLFLVPVVDTEGGADPLYQAAFSRLNNTNDKK